MCGWCHLWQCHSADPGFAHKAVNPATMFAQGAIFQIIIFHLKDDENHQLLTMDSTFTNWCLTWMINYDFKLKIFLFTIQDLTPFTHVNVRTDVPYYSSFVQLRKLYEKVRYWRTCRIIQFHPTTQPKADGVLKTIIKIWKIFHKNITFLTQHLPIQNL